MTFTFAKKNIFRAFALALCFAFALSSCTNDVESVSVVSLDYTFPKTTGLASARISQIYNDNGVSVEEIQTFFLQGWEDIPFLRMGDICKLLRQINERRCEWFLGEDGIYRYRYCQDDAGTVYPAEWKDDTLCFDVNNQKIYSDDFTRIISPKSLISNGIGTVYCQTIASATTASPIITITDPSIPTGYVKQKETTTINLKDYGLKMYVFDTTKYNSEIFQGYEHDLFVPFQVIADTFFRIAICSFNGSDYYMCLDPYRNDVATRRAYDSGRNPRSTRSRLKAEYNYRNLCLLFDKNYCLKEQRSIVGKGNIGARISDSIFRAGLGFDLISTDTAAYDTALAKFLMTYIDDGHTSYIEPSMYQGPGSVRSYQVLAGRSAGPRGAELDRVNEKMNKLRDAAGGGQGVFYVEDGGVKKMAVIVFDGFVEEKPGAETNLPALAKLNTYQFFEQAFKDIAKYSTVENVVIDLSCNGGGFIYQCMLALCYLEDPNVFYLTEKNHLDNSIAKFYCKIQDDKSATSLKKNYHFYVLTSGFSFSCGNFFPSVCHYQLNIPIVGQRSGGGGGVVKATQTSDGALFNTSASAEMCALDANGNYVCIDNGIPVDHEIPYEKFYSGAVIYQDLYNMLKDWYPTKF